MSRELTVTANPLRENHILGLREQAATATHGPIEIVYDHGFGFGRAVLTITVRYPDGRVFDETINLTEMFSEWALGIINEHKYTPLEGATDGH